MKVSQGRRAAVWNVGVCLTALALATPAAAQQAAVGEAGSTAEDDVIVVTGSRIARPELAGPAPVVTVSAEELLRSGETDITNLLREIPALNTSLAANQSAVTAAPNGVGLLDLRGLGAERTLVLQNGRRHVSGLAGSQAVDTATIPLALVERVDVLTGGASSVYGADAVSGVVNFILKDDFEGLDYRSQFGISDEGDAEDYFISLTAGTNFADGRGNVVVSAEYTRTTPLSGFDRPDIAGNDGQASLVAAVGLEDFFGVPQGADQAFAVDVRFPFSSAAGLIDVFGADIPSSIFVNGVFRDFDFGTLTDNFDAIGGDGIDLITTRDFIQPEIDRFNFNANAVYKFNKYVNWFLEGKFVYTEAVDVTGVNGFNDFIPISLENPFIPSALRSLLDDAIGLGDEPDVFISRDTLDDATAPRLESERFTVRAVTGLKGEFDNGWQYEASFNYGRTEVNQTSFNTRLEDRFFAAVDAVGLDADDIAGIAAENNAFVAQALRNGNLVTLGPSNPAQLGDIVCRSELQEFQGVEPTDPPVGSFPDVRTGFLTFDPGDDSCVPTSLFGENAINSAAAAFAFVPTFDNEELTQTVATVLLSGDTSRYFSLPAGPISFAVGFEYRQERSEDNTDPLQAAGLTFNAVTTATPPSSGRFDVKEFFGEASIPVVKDLPLIKELTFDGSFRRADYSTVGTNVTWAIGGSWAVVDDLRFRGTFGRAVRAPNIFELFRGQTPAFIAANDDPCNPAELDNGTEFREANCAALVGPGFVSTNTAFVTGLAGGNPDLQEERATTITAGIVLQPRWTKGLTLIADFYDIRIDEAIVTIDGLTIAENCVDAPTLDNGFCPLVFRDPVSGSINGFISGEQNIAALETRGIDFSARYTKSLDDFGLEGWGDLTLGVVANRILRRDDFQFQEFPDQVDPALGELLFPRWTMNLNTNWRWNNFQANFQSRLRSSTLLGGIESEEFANNPLTAVPNMTGISFVHDLQVSYDLERFGGEQTVYAGINNIGDRDPFLGSLTLPASFVGRFFFVGLRGRF